MGFLLLEIEQTSSHTQNGEFTYASGLGCESRASGEIPVQLPLTVSQCKGSGGSDRALQRNAPLPRFPWLALGRDQHLDHFNLR